MSSAVAQLQGVSRFPQRSSMDEGSVPALLPIRTRTSYWSVPTNASFYRSLSPIFTRPTNDQAPPFLGARFSPQMHRAC